MAYGTVQWSKARAFGLFVAVTLGGGCDVKRDSSLTEPVASAPLISPAHLELGSLLSKQPVERRVELSNPGTTPLRFTGNASQSRCQWLEPLAELAPGAKVTRTVRCASDLLGPLKERLSLVETGPNARRTHLDILGTVLPLLGFDSSFVDLRPEFGATEYRDVAVIGVKSTVAKLTLEAAPPSVVTVSALPKKEGEPPRFRLTCKADRVGMHAGSVIVNTGLPDPEAISVSWGCRVPGTLEANPSTPYFNLKVSGDKAVTLEVKSSQPDFKVRSVHIKDGPFTATVEPGSAPGIYRILVKVLNAKIPDDARAATGTLVVESNDAREPRKEIPLFGFGQINKVERPESN